MSTTSRGFTLVELLVSVMVSSILIGVTVSIYSVFRRTLAADQNVAALSQNARVSLDRMSREIRQAPAIVTIFPDDPGDSSPAQPGEIEFEDGHANNLTYHRYYVSGGLLKMDTVEYYFASTPAVRVHWNSTGSGGVSPVRHVISTQDIGELVQSMSFYGSKPLRMVIVTSDGKQSVTFRTSLYERNL